MASTRVIAFGGRIKSGKTSVSFRVASLLGWHYASFGTYVRYVASQRGLETKRKILQSLGEELVAQDPMLFCQQAIAFSGWVNEDNLIVDGIRHLRVLTALEQFTHSSVDVIFVDASDELRLRRDPELRARAISDHSTESQADVLRVRAGLTINTDQSASIDESARIAIEWIKRAHA